LSKFDLYENHDTCPSSKEHEKALGSSFGTTFILMTVTLSHSLRKHLSSQVRRHIATQSRLDFGSKVLTHDNFIHHHRRSRRTFSTCEICYATLSSSSSKPTLQL